MHGRLRRFLAASTFLLASIGLFVVAAPAQAQSADDKLCLGCHEAQGNIANTRHGVKSDPKTPYGSGQACSSCHGANPNHPNDPAKNPMPNKFGKGHGQAETQVCMTCHVDNRHLAFWESGRHSLNDVSCSSCHNVHRGPTPGSAQALEKRDPKVSPFTTTERQLEYETCGTCHKQVRSQIFKPSHHPIWEGKITCSDCHNPHGALTPAMLKNESVNQQCLSCHADKRGPYMFEHPAVEESCLSCHNPHGSSHGRLLNEKVPNLCQDCHDWSRHPGTAYSGNQGFAPGAQNTRFLARSCLNCHNAIHGSNAPANRGKFLTR